MVTSLLTDDDYSDDDVLEIGEDRTSARQFWAAILHLGVQDAAERIVYCPQRDCLSVVVGGTTYEMVPPHRDVQDWMLRIGRELAVGHRWLEPIYRALAVITHRPFFGRIEVDIKGRHSTWVVECRFKPLAELILTPYTVVT